MNRDLYRESLPTELHSVYDTVCEAAKARLIAWSAEEWDTTPRDSGVESARCISALVFRISPTPFPLEALEIE